MLSSLRDDPQFGNFVGMFDWYILPVTNPDGYEYTWKDDKVPVCHCITQYPHSSQLVQFCTYIKPHLYSEGYY